MISTLTHAMSGAHFFRKSFGRRIVLQSIDQSLLHNAIYIQRRNHIAGEDTVGRQKRIKSASTSPIRNNYSAIRSVTTINQTNSKRTMYACAALHSRNHGLVHQNDITNQHVMCNFVGITSKTLSSSATGPWRVAKHHSLLHLTVQHILKT